MKYLWYTYKNAYNKNECKNIYNSIISSENSTLIDRPGQNKNVNVKIFNTDKNILELLSGFFSTVKETNRENFGLELFTDIPTSGNLNIYSGKTNSYGYHSHFAELASMQDLKFTAILNISLNPYVGGEFDFFVGEDSHVEDLDEPGSILIFPSFLWHRVRPVTNGERLTVSYWFYGPNFR